MYMSGMANYPSVEEAKKSGVTFTKFVVLERHQDGTASIVYLQTIPVQPGQVEYRGYIGDREASVKSMAADLGVKMRKNRPLATNARRRS